MWHKTWPAVRQQLSGQWLVVGTQGTGPRTWSRSPKSGLSLWMRLPTGLDLDFLICEMKGAGQNHRDHPRSSFHVTNSTIPWTQDSLCFSHFSETTFHVLLLPVTHLTCGNKNKTCTWNWAPDRICGRFIRQDLDKIQPHTLWCRNEAEDTPPGQAPRKPRRTSLLGRLPARGLRAQRAPEGIRQPESTLPFLRNFFLRKYRSFLILPPTGQWNIIKLYTWYIPKRKNICRSLF